MNNESQSSLYYKIRNNCLRDQIKSLNEPNMTSYEQVLIQAVEFSLFWYKIICNTVESNLEEGKDFDTKWFPPIKEFTREILNLYNDFNTLFHFIKSGLMEKLVNKDYVKFDEFFYSRYGGILKAMNKIRYDTRALLSACRKKFSQNEINKCSSELLNKKAPSKT